MTRPQPHPRPERTRTDDPGLATALLRAPIDARTYRAIAYHLLALPLGTIYFAVVVAGLATTLGLSVTLLGPIALVVTLLFVVALAYSDGKLSGLLLGVDVSPGFPDTDGSAKEFLIELLSGRSTWVGIGYLLWRFVYGLVGFLVVVVGLSVAASLIAAPFVYGETLTVRWFATTYRIDTLSTSLLTAGAGIVVGVVTLQLSWRLGHVAGIVTSALLNADDEEVETGTEPDHTGQ